MFSHELKNGKLKKDSKGLKNFNTFCKPSHRKVLLDSFHPNNYKQWSKPHRGGKVSLKQIDSISDVHNYLLME